MRGTLAQRDGRGGTVPLDGAVAGLHQELGTWDNSARWQQMGAYCLCRGCVQAWNLSWSLEERLQFGFIAFCCFSSSVHAAEQRA